MRLDPDMIRPADLPRREGLGAIVLVGAGPGAKDLLTLRAVRALQEADVVFFDRLVEDDVVDLAHPRAERIFVGKHVGAHSWPQERINQVIVTEALAGRRVVRLKSGDPCVFGRASEEIDAARAHGIPVEIVPGITAASAAAAAMGESLTTRDVANTLILSTGMGKAGSAYPDATRHAGPGTTLAFYMSVGQCERIRDDLFARGLPETAQARIAVDVAKPGQRFITGPVRDLKALLSENGVKGCAVILVTWPQTADGPVDGPVDNPARSATAGISAG